ncbi:MAG: CoA transferase [Spirochaetota bacterium]|nr:CoA transferase [Spirochaetota bacterium]
MAITKGPLSGIRVLDLSQADAGPVTTMLLGDLGAEVIKLESPLGDLMRFGDSEIKVDVKNYYMLTLNRNKKSVVLDLKGKLGKEAFNELVKVSDIVFSNFRADVPQRLGIDFDALKKINPNIIQCNLTGFGATGPYTEYPCFDIVACGHSGILSVCGEPGGSPVVPGGIALADLMSGIYAVLSILAALINKNQDGEGIKVDANMLDSLLFMQKVLFQSYFSSGKVVSFQGRRHHMLPTYGIFKTKDGSMTLGPTNEDKLIELVGLGWMLEDPKYNNIVSRVVNKEEFTKYFEEALLQKTTEEWVRLFRDENDWASGPVYNYDQVTKDPQVSHNNMIKEMELKGKKYKTIGSVFKMHGMIEGEPDPPPDLGEQTEEILRDVLGYSGKLINDIKSENEIGAWRMRGCKK